MPRRAALRLSRGCRIVTKMAGRQGKFPCARTKMDSADAARDASGTCSKWDRRWTRDAPETSRGHVVQELIPKQDLTPVRCLEHP